MIFASLFLSKHDPARPDASRIIAIALKSQRMDDRELYLELVSPAIAQFYHEEDAAKLEKLIGGEHLVSLERAKGLVHEFYYHHIEIYGVVEMTIVGSSEQEEEFTRLTKGLELFNDHAVIVDGAIFDTTESATALDCVRLAEELHIKSLNEAQEETQRLFEQKDARHETVIFDVEKAKKLKLSDYQKQLFKTGPYRALRMATGEMLDDLAQLAVEMPNFGSAIDEISAMVAVSAASEAPIKLLNLLLVGDPGIGKSYFTSRLSDLLGVEKHMVDMASTTAGFVLGGMAPSWADAQPGRIFTSLLHSQHANHIIVLDELDKVSQDNRYDPIGPLYSLLEPTSAKHFSDEYFSGALELDASHIIFLATANSLDTITDPILSRFNIVQVETPDFDEKCRIAKLAFRNLLHDLKWQSAIETEISEDVAAAIAEMTDVRAIKKELTIACGRAIRAGRNYLLADDIQARPEVQKRRPAFV